MRNVHRLIVAIFILLCGHGTWLRAQQPDMRVSPDEPTSFRVPMENAIQSAVTSGGITLAAWGTTVSSLGGVVPAIWCQALLGSSPAGPGHILTDSASRPSWFVLAIPLRQGFMVVWNDARKDAPGLYARVVGASGEPATGVLRLSSRIVSHGIARFGDPSKGQLLVWNDESKGTGDIYGVHIGPNGEPGEDQWLGPGIGRVLTFDELPWSTFFESDGAFRFVNAAGNLDPRIIKAELLAPPFHLRGDTSLSVVAGTSLLRYRSLFDAAPDTVIDVAALDSASAGTTMVGMNGMGENLIYFTHATITGDTATKGRIVLDAYMVRVDSLGRQSAPALLKHFEHVNGHDPNIPGYDTITTLTRVWMSQFCGNREEVEFIWATKLYYSPDDPTPIYNHLGIDSEGTFHADSGAVIGGCGSIFPNLASRDGDITASVIHVLVGERDVVLRAPTAAYEFNIPQSVPALKLIDGSLHMLWSERNEMRLGIWSPGAPVTVLDRDSFPEMPDPQLPPGANVQQRMYERDERVIPGSDAGEVYSHHLLLMAYTAHLSPHSQVYMSDFYSRIDLLLPRFGHWWHPLSIYDPQDRREFYPPLYDVWHLAEVWGEDPDRGETLVSLDTHEGTDRYNLRITASTLHGYGRDSASSWSIEGIPLEGRSGLLLPAGYRRFLRIAGDTDGVLYEGVDILASFPLPKPGPSPRYLRLLGDRFLRTSWIDTSGSDLRCEIFDMQGVRQASAVVHLPSRNGEFTIVQGHADSSLVIVTFDSTGLRATLRTSRLDPVASGLLISPTASTSHAPAAAIRGDTLFVVWQDMRRGIADIYANYLPLRGYLADAGSLPDDAADALRLYPNPAHDIVTIELPSHGAGAVHVEMTDAQGGHVGSAVGEGGHVDIEVGHLPSGIYHIRITSGDRAYARRLVVVR